LHAIDGVGGVSPATLGGDCASPPMTSPTVFNPVPQHVTISTAISAGGTCLVLRFQRIVDQPCTVNFPDLGYHGFPIVLQVIFSALSVHALRTRSRKVMSSILIVCLRTIVYATELGLEHPSRYPPGGLRRRAPPPRGPDRFPPDM